MTLRSWASIQYQLEKLDVLTDKDNAMIVLSLLGLGKKDPKNLKTGASVKMNKQKDYYSFTLLAKKITCYYDVIKFCN